MILEMVLLVGEQVSVIVWTVISTTVDDVCDRVLQQNIPVLGNEVSTQVDEPTNDLRAYSFPLVITISSHCCGFHPHLIPRVSAVSVIGAFIGALYLLWMELLGTSPPVFWWIEDRLLSLIVIDLIDLDHIVNVDVEAGPSRLLWRLLTALALHP